MKPSASTPKQSDLLDEANPGLGMKVDNAAWLINALRKLGLTEAKQQALQPHHWPACRCMYFEETVEEKLWQPTFICEHPVEISPLARASDHKPGGDRAL